jgi:hypothetical protein
MCPSNFAAFGAEKPIIFAASDMDTVGCFARAGKTSCTYLAGRPSVWTLRTVTIASALFCIHDGHAKSTGRAPSGNGGPNASRGARNGRAMWWFEEVSAIPNKNA